MCSVAVIGAGPAGLIAAGTAAARGCSVTIYEKNKYSGRKLLITGKGRCNVTTAVPQDEFLNYVTGSPKFLYSALSEFSCQDTMNFFEELGVPLKVERGDRVFPVSDKAVDIRDALVKFAKSAGVTFVTKEIKELPNADAVIIATGGISYPLTGSTGDGYRFAREIGHTIKEPRASLVSLVCKESFCADMAGLSLRNVRLEVYGGKKKPIYSDMGEMLFTHYGISGPLVLSASALIKEYPCKAYIDFKPALSKEKLDARILRDFDEYKNRDFSNALNKLLPSSAIPVMVEMSGIDKDKKVNNITKEERKALVDLFKAFPLTITKARPIDEAIVTAGGVSTKEIDPKTMRSKLDERIFFAGEVIDVDALTGGFNLQIAFSTGRLAGMNV